MPSCSWPLQLWSCWACYTEVLLISTPPGVLKQWTPLVGCYVVSMAGCQVISINGPCFFLVSGMMFPALPLQFQLTVEDNTATTLIKNYTSEYEEYYDFVNNRAAIFYYSNFLTTRDYLLFDTSELITIRDDECFVNPLNSSEGIIPVGFIDVNSTSHLLTPTFIIKLGADIPVGSIFLLAVLSVLSIKFRLVQTEYNGTDVVRGINVNKWYSCSYIPNLASTVRISWSFSGKHLVTAR